MARYLVENHGFKAVNILDLFRKHVAEQNNFKKDDDFEEPFGYYHQIKISGSQVKEQESPSIDKERAELHFKNFDQDGESPIDPISMDKISKFNGIINEGGEKE